MKEFKYKDFTFQYKKKCELLSDIFKQLNIDEETNIYSNYLVWSNKLRDMSFDDKLTLYVDYRLVRQQIRNNSK